ncbi:MAG: biotin--[acetyl-CoA-carboxylase] ligase [Clostridioides sp.]|jgi:BirA family biotin operon repressor/biotin-[acetyl-CoA-carboxylase] ligase|nr:biotin--[acetyl-CoA-carboxylase] ligase [Clostridioides sp.]
MLKNDILNYLVSNAGEIVTGGKIAEYLNVSRTAVWKNINSLIEEGYEIEKYQNSGYKLTSLSDKLLLESINKNLRTSVIGKEILILDSIDSTNNYMKQQDTTKLDEGFAVTANEQTSGRGRFNRPFYSQKGEGIYLSFLLKPQTDIKNVPFITICAAVSVVKAIKNVTNIDVSIKWVNDIFYNKKKLCGILTEGVISAELGTLDYVVVGIGLNTGNIPKEVDEIATSISNIIENTSDKVLCNTNPLENTSVENDLDEFTRNINNLKSNSNSDESNSKIVDLKSTKILEEGFRNILIAEIMNQFEIHYIQFLNGDVEDIVDFYSNKLFIINKFVTVKSGDSLLRGKVVGIDKNCHLLIEEDDKKIISISSGEVILN